MIDGKVFAIQRARAASRHASQTSHLSQEISTLKEENAAMRQLLSEAVGEQAAVTLPRLWYVRAKALLRGQKSR
jgi:hypothetical protein